MTLRISANLVFFALVVALTNLRAAEPAVEPGKKPTATLTRPDPLGHPLPEGEGRNTQTQFSQAAVNEGEGRETQTEVSPAPLVGDAWRTSFNNRLDESIARLQTDGTKKRSGAVEVTRGGRIADPGRGPFAATAVGPEKDGPATTIARLLQEHGLPPGLTSVVAVESAFNPLALSPKGARGLWQLMPDTARRYGLKVERNEDERINPLKATHAAAAYMKDLFAQFQDWPLALAAYNAGEDRVARAMIRTGARDFWTLRRHGALPDETLRYVPAVLKKFEPPLDAPETERSTSSYAPGQIGSPAGRIAYATPAVHGD